MTDYLLPTHVANIALRTTYASTETNGTTIQSAPSNVKQAVLAIKIVSTELHELTHTVYGIRDLVRAQKSDVHVLVLEKLVNNEDIDQDFFPEDVRTFARIYFKQKKDLLFVNSNGVLRARYPPSQCLLHERPCKIVMPQLYQHEILFRACDAFGHLGISIIVARLQERHIWPGIRPTIGVMEPISKTFRLDTLTNLFNTTT